MEKLDFIESQAKALATFSLETMELLNKRAHALVTLLLGGGGALAAYGVALLDRQAAPWLTGAVLAAAAFLFLVAGLAVLKCVKTEPVVPLGHDPRDLMKFEDVQLEVLRNDALYSLGRRMEAWTARNVRQALWLDRCYIAAACTPLWSSAWAGAVFWLGSGAAG